MLISDIVIVLYRGTRSDHSAIRKRSDGTRKNIRVQGRENKAGGAGTRSLDGTKDLTYSTYLYSNFAAVQK